jgi:uncharacterized protein (DUF488 family)
MTNANGSVPDTILPAELTVWTVGHSTRPADEFLALLATYDIQLLVDVRRFPGSRRHPQFARESLERSIADAGRAYRWMPELGGRRTARKDSVNTGWRVAAFRGYADYMETPEFQRAFDELVVLAHAKRTAVMCAEILWWQCHRRLIADQLLARGYQVVHILSADDAKPHAFIPPAAFRNGQLFYAAEQPDLDL